MSKITYGVSEEEQKKIDSEIESLAWSGRVTPRKIEHLQMLAIQSPDKFRAEVKQLNQGPPLGAGAGRKQWEEEVERIVAAEAQRTNCYDTEKVRQSVLDRNPLFIEALKAFARATAKGAK